METSYLQKEFDARFSAAVQNAWNQRWEAILLRPQLTADADHWRTVLPLPATAQPPLGLSGQLGQLMPLSPAYIHAMALNKMWEPKARQWLDRLKEQIKERVSYVDGLVNDLLPKIRLMGFEYSQRQARNYVLRSVSDWTLREFLYEPSESEEKFYAELEIPIPAKHFDKGFVIRLFSQQQSVSVVTATDQPPLTSDQPKAGAKRGPYNKPQQEQSLKVYESEVRDAIAKAIREDKKPDKTKIEKLVRQWLIDNRGYNERTLRKHLPSALRSELFGKIYRQVSETIGLTNR